MRNIVFYLYSTSNHNQLLLTMAVTLLYSIFILHQTTTMENQQRRKLSLYSIFILHQTTTSLIFRCIPVSLYSIFILHQTTTSIELAIGETSLYSIFILHQTTTLLLRRTTRQPLYSIFILHQTTTFFASSHFACHCILSLFYIKPQHAFRLSSEQFIVFYLYSTSNHNIKNVFVTTDSIVFYLYSTSNHNLKPWTQ